MTAVVRDEFLPRSIMFLCVGAASLLAVHGLVGSNNSDSVTAEPTQKIVFSKVPAVTHTKVLVDLSDRSLYLYKKQKLLVRYPVAIGQQGWETPIGAFHITHKQQHPQWRHPITGEIRPAGADNPLGTRWIGFWSNGRTEVGFHGTNQEELVGQAVSHGCLRLRNRDIEALYERVPEGTLVVVQP